MQQNDPRYVAYQTVLRNHLCLAMGCTEPIAIAYAAAVAREALGERPEQVEVLVSGNILKNAKSVTVPNTHGRKGIAAACAAGIVAGDAKLALQVIAHVSPEQQAEIGDYLSHVTVSLLPDARQFDILVNASGGGHTAGAHITDRHTHLIEVLRDGAVVQRDCSPADDAPQTDPHEALLTVEGIFDFANTCDLTGIQALLERQMACNWAIAEEGLRGEWGAGVGRVLLGRAAKDDVRTRACAYAAAGSDARMSGCELPVVINSGSGNQGLTVSLPLMVYAEAYAVSRERLFRALALANLVAIRQKSLIGCLSAFCGAVSAGCACGAGIAYLLGGDLNLINHTLVNGLAILSGTICDGAKPSCAAKIAAAVDAALLGYDMALARKEFRDGEGIVLKGVENTMRNIGRLGKEGMRETDREIIRMMIG